MRSHARLCANIVSLQSMKICFVFVLIWAFVFDSEIKFKLENLVTAEQLQNDIPRYFVTGFCKTKQNPCYAIVEFVVLRNLSRRKKKLDDTEFNRSLSKRRKQWHSKLSKHARSIRNCINYNYISGWLFLLLRNNYLVRTVTLYYKQMGGVARIIFI